MELTNDYAERVYAGVLGKVIGVYLGRPFAPGEILPARELYADMFSSPCS
ncbi:MAG: hypothetical protein IH908_13765 [Proteobacteria bacterium]|nr:hypothetical protein [Pseudomonadota bacterium]